MSSTSRSVSDHRKVPAQELKVDRGLVLRSQKPKTENLRYSPLLSNDITAGSSAPGSSRYTPKPETPFLMDGGEQPKALNSGSLGTGERLLGEVTASVVFKINNYYCLKKSYHMSHLAIAMQYDLLCGMESTDVPITNSYPKSKSRVRDNLEATLQESGYLDCASSCPTSLKNSSLAQLQRLFEQKPIVDYCTNEIRQRLIFMGPRETLNMNASTQQEDLIETIKRAQAARRLMAGSPPRTPLKKIAKYSLDNIKALEARLEKFAAEKILDMSLGKRYSSGLPPVHIQITEAKRILDASPRRMTTTATPDAQHKWSKEAFDFLDHTATKSQSIGGIEVPGLSPPHSPTRHSRSVLRTKRPLSSSFRGLEELTSLDLKNNGLGAMSKMLSTTVSSDETLLTEGDWSSKVKEDDGQFSERWIEKSLKSQGHNVITVHTQEQDAIPSPVSSHTLEACVSNVSEEQSVASPAVSLHAASPQTKCMSAGNPSNVIGDIEEDQLNPQDMLQPQQTTRKLRSKDSESLEAAAVLAAVPKGESEESLPQDEQPNSMARMEGPVDQGEDGVDISDHKLYQKPAKPEAPIHHMKAPENVKQQQRSQNTRETKHENGMEADGDQSCALNEIETPKNAFSTVQRPRLTERGDDKKGKDAGIAEKPGDQSLTKVETSVHEGERKGEQEGAYNVCSKGGYSLNVQCQECSARSGNLPIGKLPDIRKGPKPGDKDPWALPPGESPWGGVGKGREGERARGSNLWELKS